MRGFTYARPSSAGEAVEMMTQAAGRRPRFFAGGTTLVDLMKLEVEVPGHLIDLTGLSDLAEYDVSSPKELVFGSLVRMSDIADDRFVQAHYPALSESLWKAASQQLRNMATLGGNLLQRTRCAYFRDSQYPCNKRQPGSGCSAIEGINRGHAILGTSEHCIATHPSDMCVALAALEARVLATGRDGQRSIAFAEFHRLPGDAPQIDSNLRADEIITAIELPPKGFAANYTYLKIRDRLSYAFALISIAVGLDMEGNTIKEAHLALGGVAHKPWRDRQAEAQLNGAPATRETFLHAADTVLRDARGFGHNDFKIELARRGILRALTQAARGTPQSQADKRIK